MENEPRYIGTPKDLSERVLFEFAPAIKDNMQQGKLHEVSGIIKLQANMVREILPKRSK